MNGFAIDLLPDASDTDLYWKSCCNDSVPERRETEGFRFVSFGGCTHNGDDPSGGLESRNLEREQLVSVGLFVIKK